MSSSLASNTVRVSNREQSLLSNLSNDKLLKMLSVQLSVGVFAVAISSSVCDNLQRRLQSVLLDKVVGYKRL